MQNMDTFIMSLQAIRANKLRSSLTLVGIVLGVASIIAVMTGISVVQETMEKEMSVLGAQTFQVQKWPAGFSSDEAYFAVQGLGSNGQPDPQRENLIDIDNLIDYMITNIYVGNTDWPHKNYWVGRARSDSTVSSTAR